MPQETTRSVYV